MGVSGSRAIRAVCDGCGGVQLAQERIDIVGFIGSAKEQHHGGWSGRVSWFACSAMCIQNAVEKVIAEAYEN